MTLVKTNTGLLKSVRSWGALGLVLVLAVVFGAERATLPVLAQGERVQVNPCQSIIDAAVRQAQTGRAVDLEKFRKDLKDCATKNGIPVVESEVSGKGEQARVAVAPATNLPGGVWPCLGSLPAGFLFWFVAGAGTFTQPQYAGNFWNVATVQLESTRSSVLYSFAPGFGFSVSGGVVRSVVAPFTPPPSPVDLMILWVTWGSTSLTPAPFFPGAQAVCMAMDRS